MIPAKGSTMESMGVECRNLIKKPGAFIIPGSYTMV